MPTQLNRSSTSTRPLAAVVWGRVPPPIGGVTRSVAGQIAHLRARGIPTLSFGPQSLRRDNWPTISELRSFLAVDFALFNLSGIRSLAVAPTALATRRSRTVLYVHGGTVGARLASLSGVARFFGKRGLAIFDEVWVTNADIGTAITEKYGQPTAVVSPYVESTIERGPKNKGTGHRLLTAAYNASSIYCLDIVLDAFSSLKDMDPRFELTVLLYGNAEQAIADCRDMIRTHDAAITVVVNESPETVEGLLGETDVLLRITTTDGDSMIVREAAALGVRVLASDNVPRPPGTELCTASTDSIVAAVQNSGRASDGAGLGVSCGVMIDQALSSLLTARDQAASPIVGAK